jgi:hypothetical protein
MPDVAHEHKGTEEKIQDSAFGFPKPVEPVDLAAAATPHTTNDTPADMRAEHPPAKAPVPKPHAAKPRAAMPQVAKPAAAKSPKKGAVPHRHPPLKKETQPPVQVTGSRPWVMGRVYGAVLVVALLALIGTFFLVPRQKTASAYAPVFEAAGKVTVADPTPPAVEDLVEEAPPEIVQPSPAAAVAKPKATAKKQDFDPSLPLAVIGVPDVGLRATHSLEAKVFPGKIKKGDKVAILKRYAPGTGPTWMKIQTKEGKTGWVFASVLLEKKAKGK